MIATATRLTSQKRRAIHLVALLTVPTSRPIDSAMLEAEEKAQRKIEEAKLMAGMRVSGKVVRVRPGQEGYYLAEQARESKAEAIVIGMRRRGGVPLYGKVLETVLRERPCRVIVVSEGGESETEAVGARSAAMSGVATP